MSFLHKHKIIVNGGALLAAILFATCKYEYVQEDPVCFERDVQPIIISNCTQSGCHNATDREKGRDYSTYEGVVRDVEAGNYQKSDLYKVLVVPFRSAAMPQEPYSLLTTEQIRVIATWIEQGAVNEVCAASNCDTTGTISYVARVKPTLETYCNGCHGGTAQAGAGIVLSDYNNVKKSVDNGTLIGSVKHDSGYSQMPKGGNKLSNCNIALIQKWINEGALNN